MSNRADPSFPAAPPLASPFLNLRHKLAVMVVDDMKFSCAFIRQVLSNQGYEDIRVANSATQALQLLQERSADVVLADWMMPEMDGLQLAQRVRQLDLDAEHYTSIILLTAKEGVAPLIEAFEQGVDDYLTKPPDKYELAARVHAAGRVANLQNQLQYRLKSLHDELEQRATTDATTGLSNHRDLTKRLQELLQLTATRGGSTCCVVTIIAHLSQHRERYGDKVVEEILIATAQRLRKAIRPNDVLARLSGEEFAMGMHFPDKEPPRLRSFKRVLQAVNLRPIKTAAGYLSAPSVMGVACAAPGDAAGVPQMLIDQARVKVQGTLSAGAADIAF